MNAILDDILDETCKYYKINRWDVLGSERHQQYVNARITFSIVAVDYIDNKTTIANYLNKHASTFHNWATHDGNPEIGRAVESVRSKIKGVASLYNRIKQYIDIKDELNDLQSERHELSTQLQKLETKIQETETKLSQRSESIKMEDLTNLT